MVHEEEEVKTPQLGSESDAQKQTAENAALDSSRNERERKGGLTWDLPHKRNCLNYRLDGMVWKEGGFQDI